MKPPRQAELYIREDQLDGIFCALMATIWELCDHLDISWDPTEDPTPPAERLIVKCGLPPEYVQRFGLTYQVGMLCRDTVKDYAETRNETPPDLQEES